MLLDLLTVAVMAFVGSRLVASVGQVRRPAVRAHLHRIVGGLRLRHFLLAPVALAVVATAASLLLLVPPLRFGWWTAIGGLGNPVTGATSRTEGSALEWVVPLVFLTLLIPVLPLFAEREERMFRLGAERRTPAGRIVRGIEFGLVHAIIGIPIGVALALSIGGWYFTWWYLQGYRRGGPEEGVLESTRAHTAYNATAITIVVVAIILLRGNLE